MKTLKLMIAVLFISTFSLSMYAQTPQTAEENYKNGVAAMGEYKYNVAIKLFDLAIEQKADMAAAYYYRAVCKCNLGLNAEACPDLKKASELGHYVEKVAIPCGCDAKDPK
jgi:tetratricopeptide (TPR) repeat protein